MNVPAPQSSVVRLLIVGACAAIIVLVLHLAATVLGQILLAYFIAVALAPVVGWFRGKGLPGWLAIVIVVLLAVAVGAAFAAITAASLSQIKGNLPEYQQEFTDRQGSTITWLSDHGVNLQSVADVLTGQRVFDVVTGIITSLLRALAYSGIMLLATLFMLIDSLRMPARLAPYSEREAFKRLAIFNADIRRYALIKTVTGGAAAIADTILLLALGVDYALFFGLLSFVLSFIPNIGFLIALVPPLILAWVQFGLPGAIAVLVGYIAINGITDNVLSPRLNATRLNLSVSTTMVTVIFWGWALGPIGGLIAVPVTLMLKDLVFDAHEETRWLSDAISSHSVKQQRARARKAVEQKAVEQEE